MCYEHRGKPIGMWEKAWFKDGKLWVEGIVYEPESEREKEIVKRIESGELKGLSPSFTFNRKPEPKPEKVVLHGSVEVIGKDENGHLVVEYFIPKEEIIAKVGSIENLEKFKFTDSWLHDSSEETKKKIEADYKKKP